MTMNDPSQARYLSSAELFREHAGFVARFLFRLGVPAQAIDDAVQDVFVVVHQRGGYRPGPAKPTTYLALIASHAASAQRRRQRIGAARLGTTQLDELEVQSDDPAVHTERRDELRRLQEALALLDPPLRDTLLLADCEEESAPEIARAMGVPVGTVYWRLHEARKKFQRALSVADRSRAQAASRRLPPASRPSSTRSRGALALIFGLLDRESQRAAMHELSRTLRALSFDFDLERGLRRHLELVATLPASPSALPDAAPTMSAGVTALKGALWTIATVCALVATFQLLTRRSDAATAERAVLHAPAQREALVTQQAVTQQPVTAASAVEAANVAQTESAPSEPTPRRATNAQEARAEDATAQRAARAPRAAARFAAPRAQTATDTSAGRTSAPASTNRSADDRASAGGPAAKREGPADGGRAAADAARSTSPEPEPPAPPAPASAQPDAAAQPRADAPRAEADSRAALGEQAPVREAQALARAESLLATQPEKALAIVEELSRRAPRGYLAEERLYIQIMALYGLGRRGEADKAADTFLSRYRESIFRERMSAARRAALRP